VPDLCHRQVCLGQEVPRLLKAALGDPLLHRASRLAPDDGGQVARGEADRPGHVLERNGIPVALFYAAEDLGEHGLVVEPEIPHHLGGEPRDAHQQQHQVRQRRLPIPIPALLGLALLAVWAFVMAFLMWREGGRRLSSGPESARSGLAHPLQPHSRTAVRRSG
jgi:hypothetical protein